MGKGPEDRQRNKKDNWSLKLLTVCHSGSCYPYISALASFKYLSIYGVATRGSEVKATELADISF